MAAFEPPTEITPEFNSLFFQTPNVASLSIADADQRYLARKNVATSVASSTSFASDLTGLSFQGQYRTFNSTEPTTHFLNFVNSSATGVGNIQKSAGLSYVPSTQVLTVNNGISIPTGPILGRNDTGANTFDGTLTTATHPIGWTIKFSKAFASFTSGVTFDVIAGGTPTTVFNTLSNGVWRIGCSVNNVTVQGNSTLSVLSYGAFTGGTVINGSTGTGASSMFHNLVNNMTGTANWSYSYPEIIVRTTGNGTTGLIININTTYTVQPTLTFNMWCIKVG